MLVTVATFQGTPLPLTESAEALGPQRPEARVVVRAAGREVVQLPLSAPCVLLSRGPAFLGSSSWLAWNG